MRTPEEELSILETANLRRSLRRLDAPQGIEMNVEGLPIVNFSSNDYLGLASDPWLVETLREAVARHGAGSGASRLVCGTLSPHVELEETLADMKKRPASLCFSSGYTAAMGTLSALAAKGDVVILDKLCHASLVDGARLSGATIRVFPHNDLNKLRYLLAWAEKSAGPKGRSIVVTESVFSMDGDQAALREIVALKTEFGAWLLVDEAHAFGIFGENGSGLASSLGLADGIDLHLGTFSKAVGLSGGYVCATRPIIDLLINKARSFIYSTAPPPCIAAAVSAVLKVIFTTHAGRERRASLWKNIHQFTTAIGAGEGRSAIIPWIVGSEADSLTAAQALANQGFLVPAIRYPTVPRGKARLRISLCASHPPHQVDALASALLKHGCKTGQ